MSATVKRKNSSSLSLENFIRENNEKGDSDSGFEKVSERVLRIDVDGTVWLKHGTAIAYYGDLKFERLAPLKGKKVKEAVLREIVPLASATGKGRLYCASHGWHLRVIRLEDETINISADGLLAFEDTLEFELFMAGTGISSITSGGIFAVKLSGSGLFALAVHGDPLVLPITPDKPLCTDPNATMGWSEGLSPKLKTDLDWRSIFWHGGGEAFQMLFEGEGYVIVQPSEEKPMFTGKRLRKLF